MLFELLYPKMYLSVLDQALPYKAYLEITASVNATKAVRVYCLCIVLALGI